MKGESDPVELTPPKLASRRRGSGSGGDCLGVSCSNPLVAVTWGFSTGGLCLSDAKVLALGSGLDGLDSETRSFCVSVLISFRRDVASDEGLWGGGRGGRPLVKDDMFNPRLSSPPLGNNADAEGTLCPDDALLCGSSTLLAATLGRLFKLSRLILELWWKSHLKYLEWSAPVQAPLR